MSRLRSAPAARGGRAAAAARGGQRGVYVQQAKSDVYVAMLGVALGAMVIGCLLLLLVWGRYDYKTTVSATTATPPAPFANNLAALPGPTPSALG